VKGRIVDLGGAGLLLASLSLDSNYWWIPLIVSAVPTAAIFALAWLGIYRGAEKISLSALGFRLEIEGLKQRRRRRGSESGGPTSREPPLGQA
jgi:hypothetical protein